MADNASMIQSGFHGLAQGIQGEQARLRQEAATKAPISDFQKQIAQKYMQMMFRGDTDPYTASVLARHEMMTAQPGTPVQQPEMAPLAPGVMSAAPASLGATEAPTGNQITTGYRMSGLDARPANPSPGPGMSGLVPQTRGDYDSMMQMAGVMPKGRSPEQEAYLIGLRGGEARKTESSRQEGRMALEDKRITGMGSRLDKKIKADKDNLNTRIAGMMQRVNKIHGDGPPKTKEEISAREKVVKSYQAELNSLRRELADFRRAEAYDDDGSIKADADKIQKQIDALEILATAKRADLETAVENDKPVYRTINGVTKVFNKATQTWDKIAQQVE